MSGSSFLADLLETVSDRGRALLRRGDPNGPSGPGGPDALIDLTAKAPRIRMGHRGSV